MTCRFCGEGLTTKFITLNAQPPANKYLTAAELKEPESKFPLTTYVCGNCLLVQLAEEKQAAEIFKADYAYYSAYSASWVEHARLFVEMSIDRFQLGRNSFVVEIASNDGYLLQHFVQRGIPCLGVDPAAEAAEDAADRGVETIIDFFNRDLAGKLARDRGRADLLVGNNVLAHVPELNDFVSGIRALLKPQGIVAMEFPHILRFIENVQFDTIYDEHFSYFSFHVVRRIFAEHGLTLFDVEELGTHGGSIRIFGAPADGLQLEISPAVARLLDAEREAGLDQLSGYLGLQDKVDEICGQFLKFMKEQLDAGKSIAAFGAAAKGNTFLNACGVSAGQISYVVDDTPAKQGKYLPQSHIPVVKEDRIRETEPDFIIILPWNVRDDILDKLEYARDWGCQFVTCIPKLQIH
ncbi:MAG: class I SAM-dependent methyltransferase [Rhodospirillales bacterium]|jgi:SAM-dependent methyltransferase|nr:class I SAM-dependent methyltransferase [Rhodospirillales bacterium]MDP6644925.1 class I SAM-dependent methyltransferase [Rhodospirillales bacterium]MDP6841363.1 class I SAM-dependent methyltransferase [Rhodospirillales bacterium]